MFVVLVLASGPVATEVATLSPGAAAFDGSPLGPWLELPALALAFAPAAVPPSPSLPPPPLPPPPLLQKTLKRRSIIISQCV
jgi:hypothetical protein